jgi:peroxiredoxin Q/BCP
MQVNDKAPGFMLPDENGMQVSLDDYSGKYVVLFFFPKADTPGCTTEVCTFRDAYYRIERAGAVILGISADPPEKQLQFKEKNNLPFSLLSDRKHLVCENYGVLRDRSSRGTVSVGIERTTFLISPGGRIVRIFQKVRPQGHGDEVWAALQMLP